MDYEEWKRDLDAKRLNRPETGRIKSKNMTDWFKEADKTAETANYANYQQKARKKADKGHEMTKKDMNNAELARREGLYAPKDAVDPNAAFRRKKSRSRFFGNDKVAPEHNIDSIVDSIRKKDTEALKEAIEEHKKMILTPWPEDQTEEDLDTDEEAELPGPWNNWKTGAETKVEKKESSTKGMTWDNKKQKWVLDGGFKQWSKWKRED